MDVSEKKVVTIQYTGKLDDGTVFDSSEGKQPLEFLYGVGMIIPGLEEGMQGMKEGDKKTINVSSDKAYGPRMDDAVQEVPKEQFPQDIELKEGLQLAAEGPQGQIPVVVSEIKDTSVMVDFNHPLAGKDLTFDVEIVKVRDATDEELNHGHAHPEGHEHDEVHEEGNKE